MAGIETTAGEAMPAGPVCSRRFALVVIQQPAKPLVSDDIFGAQALDGIGLFCRACVRLF